MRKIFAIFIACLLAVIGVNLTPITAFAENNEDISVSSIESDLSSFDLNDYPYDSEGKIDIIYFAEYCYSLKTEYDRKFGLYVYVYNPTETEIVTGTNYNVINMASSYGSDGLPVGYTNYHLVFIDKTENNRFYKFKIVLETAFLAKIKSYAKKNLGRRRYDVAGLQLLFADEDLAFDNKIACTYIFSGYSAGCGSLPGNTLSCEFDKFETVTLDLQHTFWRSETSSLGAYHQNQLDTVYFSIPEKYYTDYGKLQRIKAEWYEYKTAPICVTSNELLYDDLRYINGYDRDNYGLIWGFYTFQPDDPIFEFAYNDCGEVINRVAELPLKFWVSNIDDYDPLADVVEIGGVEESVLFNRIKSVSSEKYEDLQDEDLFYRIGGVRYLKSLFEDDIDDSRKMNNSRGKVQMGYSYYDFDVTEDTQNMTSWAGSDPSFWDSWRNFGFWNTIFGNIPQEENVNLAPIQELTDDDLSLTDAEFSNKFYVNVESATDIKNYSSLVKQNNERTVLFHFATSDYYCSPALIREPENNILSSPFDYIENEAYVAQESVFLNFDVIQLTFNKSGRLTVIPVVSSPINIVDDLTPPLRIGSDDGFDWLRFILGLFVVLLIVIICSPILPYVVKGLVWLVLLPFRALASIVKAIKKKRADKPKRGKK